MNKKQVKKLRKIAQSFPPGVEETKFIEYKDGSHFLKTAGKLVNHTNKLKKAFQKDQKNFLGNYAAEFLNSQKKMQTKHPQIFKNEKDIS